jgi:hypothetical protein
MNLLGPDLRCEASILWPATGEPRLYISKGVMTREEVGKIVADVIQLMVTWAAEQGVRVSGEIAPPPVQSVNSPLTAPPGA